MHLCDCTRSAPYQSHPITFAAFILYSTSMPACRHRAPELLPLPRRYVRQESELWSALHAGRLTTSRFKDALGLREHGAGRVLGGPHVSGTLMPLAW